MIPLSISYDSWHYVDLMFQAVDRRDHIYSTTFCYKHCVTWSLTTNCCKDVVDEQKLIDAFLFQKEKIEPMTFSDPKTL